jgi:hypothetical protein
MRIDSVSSCFPTHVARPADAMDWAPFFLPVLAS